MIQVFLNKRLRQFAVSSYGGENVQQDGVPTLQGWRNHLGRPSRTPTLGKDLINQHDTEHHIVCDTNSKAAARLIKRSVRNLLDSAGFNHRGIATKR